MARNGGRGWVGPRGRRTQWLRRRRPRWPRAARGASTIPCAGPAAPPTLVAARIDRSPAPRRVTDGFRRARGLRRNTSRSREPQPGFVKRRLCERGGWRAGAGARNGGGAPGWIVVAWLSAPEPLSTTAPARRPAATSPWRAEKRSGVRAGRTRADAGSWELAWRESLAASPEPRLRLGSAA